jgi:23S rRNA (uracil1939-C5)-methyltransferase
MAELAPRKARKGDELRVRIDSFDAKGRGVGTALDCRVRLRHAIPGETVRARVLRRRRNEIDGVVLERIAPSSLSVSPPCEHFGSCGGCSFQDLEYAAQLEGKRLLVETAFERIAGAVVEPVLPAPRTFAYRNKMEFAFGSRRWIHPSEPPAAPSGFALGLHAASLFHKVIDVRGCAIQSPAADRILAAAREIAIEQELAPWDVYAHTGLLRYLVVRVAATTGEILVALVTSADAPEVVERFARALLARDLGITTLVHGVNSRPADTAISERERVLFGPGWIREELGGVVFALSASSFFQTNTLAAEKLVAVVREAAELRGTEVVWDLYCGTGTLALSLARSAREVVGFEISAAAVADARGNAERNGIANARFHLGDVIDGIAAAGNESAGSDAARPDVLLLDPPRSGLHPALFPTLLALGAPRIVYVSCNPSAAARDVEHFLAAGWRLGRVRPIDLFPHTPHVECVLGLARDG